MVVTINWSDGTQTIHGAKQFGQTSCNLPNVSDVAGISKKLRDNFLKLISIELKGAVPPAPWGEGPWPRFHARRAMKLLNGMATALNEGNHKKSRHRMMLYLRSASAHYMAIARAAKKKRLDLSGDEIAEFLDGFSLVSDCGEKILEEFKLKADGSYRKIQKFGVLRTAQQYICLDIMRIWFEKPVYDYDRKGRGRNAACKRVRKIAKTCKFFVVIDLKDFFGSLSHDGVMKGLCFPHKVTRSVILDQVEATIHVNNNTTNNACNTEDTRRGIPQGSVASNFVAALLLTPVLDVVPHHGLVVVYADDILIGCHSREEAKTIKKALKTALRSCPAGPLQVKKCEIRTLSKGFDFLGYNFAYRQVIFGGKFAMRRSKAAFRKFKQKLLSKCLDAPYWEVEEIAYVYFENWLRSFSFWKPKKYEKDILDLFVNDVVESVHFGKTEAMKVLGYKKAIFNDPEFQELGDPTIDMIGYGDFDWNDHGCQFKQLEYSA